MRRILLALLALALTGCGTVSMVMAPGSKSWDAEVMGMRVHYKLVDSSTNSGVSTWFAGVCTIAINSRYIYGSAFATGVAAHEIGHCLDGAYLGWSHGGFSDEGCVYGPDYCSPLEGFAESWARAYWAECGAARSPLGLLPDDGVECAPPLPRSVTPDMARGFAP